MNFDLKFNEKRKKKKENTLLFVKKRHQIGFLEFKLTFSAIVIKHDGVV